ncbi:SRPBCC family protein [Sphingomonas sp. RHCKR7]|uniref:SRPBCC family protein n=1 Tax=Sphingomonas folli TaxID=2862497 RepID=UPI001CA5771F|nr:SRPBCC family protein [Sphingomonas folli]MBW6527879.1 SRPBCC family protein [Sphingomonas folli]
MSTAVRQDPPGAALDASAHAAVTIDRPADDLRTLWLDPRTQARIWAHFADVTARDDGTADWIARGPAGGQYRWRTKIMATSPDDIRWASLDGADVPNTGALALRPAPGDRGTELHLDVRFDPPGGIIGKAASKLFHIVPGEIVRKALYQFRALALTGEIPTTDPQPAARQGGADR